MNTHDVQNKNNGDVGVQFCISSFFSVNCDIHSFSPVIEHRSPTGWRSVGAARLHCQVSPGGLSDWSLGSSSCHRSSQLIFGHGVMGLGNSWMPLMENGMSSLFSFHFSKGVDARYIFAAWWLTGSLAKTMEDGTHNFSHKKWLYEWLYAVFDCLGSTRCAQSVRPLWHASPVVITILAQQRCIKPWKL